MYDVFLVYCELAGDSIKLRREGYAGAFVTCFVPTPDLRRALDAAEAALSEDGYQVANIDKAFRYDPEEWEHDADVNQSVAECAATQQVSYSTFEVWGH